MSGSLSRDGVKAVCSNAEKRLKQMSEVVLQSRLTCPHCGHATIETMPTDACQYFHECVQCHSVLRPKPGDCCVFCSYGSVQCPPIQASGSAGNCCSSSAATHLRQ